ncbi:hypothetical protein FACS1894219_12600 [Clostridia bacterium]|nr:hypothetical protein FACS1894219_12600 [Clostridia bacterium]
MKNEVKVLWGSDVPRLSPEEIRANIENRKREYGQMLEKLCPSKDVQKLAKRIAKQDNACLKCVYNCPPLCLFPRSDGFIEDLKIDPCYEGVLRYLRKEMTGKSDIEDTPKSCPELGEAIEAVFAAFEIAISISEIFAAFNDCDSKTQRSITTFVTGIRDDVREIWAMIRIFQERIEVSDDNETEAKTL